MADLQAALAALVSDALTVEFGADYAQTDPLIRPSTFADYQSNVALALARRLGRRPPPCWLILGSASARPRHRRRSWSTTPGPTSPRSCMPGTCARRAWATRS